MINYKLTIVVNRLAIFVSILIYPKKLEANCVTYIFLSYKFYKAYMCPFKTHMHNYQTHKKIFNYLIKKIIFCYPLKVFGIKSELTT